MMGFWFWPYPAGIIQASDYTVYLHVNFRGRIGFEKTIDHKLTFSDNIHKQNIPFYSNERRCKMGIQIHLVGSVEWWIAVLPIRQSIPLLRFGGVWILMHMKSYKNIFHFTFRILFSFTCVAYKSRCVYFHFRFAVDLI